MCFETRWWYLSWGWQGLQGLLAEFQLWWNTHMPFSSENYAQGLSSLAFAAIKCLPNEIY